jgi:hypothetical protein
MRAVLLTGLLLAVSVPAFADCRGEIAELESHVAADPVKDRRVGAMAYVGKAREQLKSGSETECHNDVVRGWRVSRSEDVKSGKKEEPYRAPNQPRPYNMPFDPKRWE